jgi:hypothetical protein
MFLYKAPGLKNRTNILTIYFPAALLPFIHIIPAENHKKRQNEHGLQFEVV